MIKFYRQRCVILIALTVAAVGLIFLAGLCEGPGPGTGPEMTVAEPGIKPEPPGQEPPPAPETPPDSPVIEPPLPGDTVPPDDPWATEHFRMAEYACDCPGYCDGWPAEMDPELLARIEALRMACGRPVIITSGVRCEARNEEVGGVTWSFHKRGQAADLYCPGMAVGELALRAQETGLNILPYYRSGYIHVECSLN
ncbi:D-Ala-D-Ala carboxypeptidase family metallohydrolase [Eubacterium sp. 1001713B170207_170306_E7]|uniref:YcbK family protein n=1 Tax=Eubacterium sp. 1001713B170207_170306_E7 TaxID=2787097 RepID=UPI001898B008|nr:D-Ala-D-Ala carboxypeptidase family metallohydrolase [Eubacterium sp. 1001713B170207_170306_E7]